MTERTPAHKSGANASAGPGASGGADASTASGAGVSSGPDDAPGAATGNGHLAAALAFTRQLAISTDCWRVIAALALSALAVQLMNRSLFPYFDGIFSPARDISVFVSSAALVAIGLLSRIKPAALPARTLMPGMLVITFSGAALLLPGILLSQPALMLVGACLLITGRSWSRLAACLSAVHLPGPQGVACICVAAFVAQLADCLCAALPQAVCALLLLVCTLICLALTWRNIQAMLQLIAGSSPEAELAVTRPATSVPYSSSLYLALFVVQAAYGFALRFGEDGGVPVFSPLVLPVLFMLLLLTLALRGRFLGDTLVNVVMLALVAGFILIMAGGASHTRAGEANNLLNVGTSLFGVLLTSTLVFLCSKNHLTSLSILGWGTGVAGFSTILGAGVGNLSNALVLAGGQMQLMLLIGLVILAVVAYCLFGLRGVSLRQIIEGVEKPGPAIDLELAGEELFARRCQDVGARFALTPREAEVFEMLARGRNREYIEDALGVSRNTVKAHVKHVYAKLDIHSHQELIDLFEATPLSGRPSQAGSQYPGL